MAPLNEKSITSVVYEQKEKREEKEEMQKIIKNDINYNTNGTIKLQLGSYKSVKLPLLVLAFGYSWLIYFTWDMKVDPRTQYYFLMSHPTINLTICILYTLFSLVWGPKMMENRKPYQLKEVKIVYNLIQVLLCVYMLIEAGQCGWWGEYSFTCQPVDYSFEDKPLRLTKVAHMYFLSKILDFVDTFFFILNKKFSHISVLHVIHHSNMCTTMWFGIKYMAGGHLTFMGYVNAMVHVLMYSYYLLAALGPAMKPYLWWKKYLTTIQLAQFVIVFFHTTQVLVTPCPTIPNAFAYLILIYAIIYFGFFLDFYIHSYKTPKKSAKSVNSNNVPLSKKVEMSSNNVRLRLPSKLMNNLTCLPDQKSSYSKIL